MGIPFRDLDAMIEDREGRRIAEIFALRGEPAFRQLEHTLTREVAEMSDAVIAPGGGWMVEERNRALLRSGSRIIYLRAAPATVAARLGRQAVARPLLGADVEGTLARLSAEREASYCAADTEMDTEGLSAHQVGIKLRDLLAPSFVKD